jgi:hypothetical protein
MSRNINVNPAHYKLAGRERQGEDVAQHLQKQAFSERRAEVERWQARHAHGAPGWEDPAQPMAEPEPPKPARRRAKPRRAKPRQAKPRQAQSRQAKSRPSPARGTKARRVVKRPRAAGAGRSGRKRTA